MRKALIFGISVLCFLAVAIAILAGPGAVLTWVLKLMSPSIAFYGKVVDENGNPVRDAATF